MLFFHGPLQIKDFLYIRIDGFPVFDFIHLRLRMKAAQVAQIFTHFRSSAWCRMMPARNAAPIFHIAKPATTSIT